MSHSAHFEIEDDDIVQLINPQSPDTMRGGWVNIGPHAVRFSYNPNTGDLEVAAFARTNEIDVLGSLVVTGDKARDAKGCEP